MTTPSWAPPPTPEQPTLPIAPQRSLQTLAIILASVAIVTVFGAGAAYYLSRQATAVVATPDLAVDALLDDLANARWSSADSRFGPECSDLSAEVLEIEFTQLMETYESHTVIPATTTDPGQDGFVRIIGSLTRTGGETNSVRADVQASVSAEGVAGWEVCGMQIYGP